MAARIASMLWASSWPPHMVPPTAQVPNPIVEISSPLFPSDRRCMHAPFTLGQLCCSVSALVGEIIFAGPRFQAVFGEADVDIVHLAVAFRRFVAEQILAVELIGDMREGGAEVLAQADFRVA